MININVKKCLKMSICAILCLLVSGCGVTMQVVGDDQVNPMIEMLARRTGCFVAKKESTENLKELVGKCQYILDHEKWLDMEEGLKYLTNTYFDDPLAYDDIVSLAKFIRIDINIPEINPDMGQVRAIKVAIQSFITGIQRCGRV